MKYLKICILLLLVAGFCYQCNPSGTETDTYSVNTIVYGDVSRFDNSDCYKARLINFAGGDTELVDGPKKFIPLFRDDPPYDSVRVDFSYPDSLR